MSAEQGNGVGLAARDWAQALAPYRRPKATRGVVELAITVLPFVALWAAMLIASRNGQILLSFAMAPFAAGLLVRLFMIQHDCGHGSFLPSKPANDWIGRAIGVLTMTPYDHWRRSHAIHHATSGNLDRRGIGDIDTLTVREYFARNWRDKLGYRLYRHPLVMFGVGPLYLFLIENRLPFGFMRKGAMPWLSTMTTNAGILVAAGLVIWGVGLAPFLTVLLADHCARRDGRRVALLRAAPVRGDDMGAVGEVEPARGGAARQFALRTAAAARLVLRQYRRAPRSSPVERYSLLSASRGFARPSRAGRGRSAPSSGQPRLRATRALGRGPTTDGVVPRRAGVATDRPWRSLNLSSRFPAKVACRPPTDDAKL